MIVRLATEAMGTRFEVVLTGDDPNRLRAIGEAALDEVRDWHGRLSLFESGSFLSYINRHASERAVRLDQDMFELLQACAKVHAASGGAFDITVAPLMRCWGLAQGEGRIPRERELQEALQCCGQSKVTLAPEDCSVRFESPGMRIDLGAIGKGYAIECAAEFLEEAGVPGALIHGGTSTAYAHGCRPDGEPWQVALPPSHQQLDGFQLPDAVSDRERPLARVSLANEAISVSAVWGKAFVREGRVYGHVIDPRRGRPVQGSLMAAVVIESPTVADALSTALLVLGAGGLDKLAGHYPGMRALIVVEEGPDRNPVIHTRGISVLSGPESD